MNILNRSGIYKITNTINGRTYYGSAQKFKKRKWEHFNDLKKNNHNNPFLQNDFNKCGEKVFAFKVIIYCDIHNLLFYEQRFLDRYFDNGKECYNMLSTAGSRLGKKHTKETKLKISEAAKGRKHTKEAKRKMSEAGKGKKHTKETKQKLSELNKGRISSFKGKKHTKETKQKMSKAHEGKTLLAAHRRKLSELNKGKKHTEETKLKISEAGKDPTIYHFFHKDGTEEKCTQYELRTKYNLRYSNLSEVVKGKRKSIKGWKVFAND